MSTAPTPDLDIARIRADCPACRRLIHFNNAGSALSPRPVLRAMMNYLELEQRVGGYEAAQEATDLLAGFYTALAGMLSCRPDEIAYMENATRAWEMALHAINWRRGDEIVTGQNEYASNYLALLHLARRRDLKVRVVPCDDSGLIDLEKLRESINHRTRTIALTHIASQRGDIQPATQVGNLAREHGLLFLLDACQSAGQLPLNVEQLNCDFLSGSGRKYLRGPRGTGFLYVRRTRLPELTPLFIDLHSASWDSQRGFTWQPGARRFECFERSLAGQLGLAEAVSYANRLGMPAIRGRIRSLAERLRDGLHRVPGVTVLERSADISGLITFASASEEASSLQQRLRVAGINTSVARQSGARLDLNTEPYGDVNRASLHYYNTEAEIAQFITELSRP